MVERRMLLRAALLAIAASLATQAYAKPERTGRQDNSKQGEQRQEAQGKRGQDARRAQAVRRGDGNGQAQNPRYGGSDERPRRDAQTHPRQQADAAGRQRWQQLSPEERQRLQQREERFRALPQDEQQRARQAEQRYRSMTPQQRDELRRRWENMSPEERDRYRRKIRERQ